MKVSHEIPLCLLEKSKEFNDFINLIPTMNTVGIYVIFATSRTTNNFITKKIKEIFNYRICFALSNYKDSLLIIDKQGAEKLDTNIPGQCLIKTQDNIECIRCAYIDNQDIEKFLKGKI